MSKSKSPKKVAPATDAAATEPVVVTTATKKADAKATKPPKVRKTPVEDLVVFAFRLTAAERDAIHKAAGPANASRFVRALTVAAARGEDDAVANVLKAVQSAS